MTQAQDAFSAAADLGLPTFDKKYVDVVIRGIKETTDTLSVSAAGNNTEVQFNDNGVLAGDANFTFDKTTAALSGGAFIPTGSTIPSNGVYLPATNTVALSTNGTGRLFIDSSGKVGIGTSSPEANLDLVDNGTFSGIRVANLTTDATTKVGHFTGRHYTNAEENVLGLRITSDSSDNSVILGGGSGLLNAATNIKFYTAANSTTTIGTQRMVIDSSGRVGIGTTSPTLGSLVVSNGAGNAANIFLNPNSGTTESNIGFSRVGNFNESSTYIAANGDTTGYLRVITDSQERARIDSSGRFLVGTSSAYNLTNANGTTNTPRLEIAGEGGNTQEFVASMGLYYFAGAVGGARASALGFARSRGPNLGDQGLVNANDRLGEVSFHGSDGTAFRPAASITANVDGVPGSNDMPGRLVFSTTADGASSPTERMTITSNGFLCATESGSLKSTSLHNIKATTAQTTFAFYNTNASSPVGLLVNYDSAAPNSTGNHFLYCSDNIGLKASIRSNGGFANYQSNNVDLSDERSKRNIESAPSTWDCVQAWEVVNYNYIDDAADDNSRIGVIAQQVQQHCPEVVIPYQEAEDATLDEEGNVITPAKEERLGVREQQMMWMAIKALQEAQVRIETLEAEVAALKAQ